MSDVVTEIEDLGSPRSDLKPRFCEGFPELRADYCMPRVHNFLERVTTYELSLSANSAASAPTTNFPTLDESALAYLGPKELAGYTKAIFLKLNSSIVARKAELTKVVDTIIEAAKSDNYFQAHFVDELCKITKQEHCKEQFHAFIDHYRQPNAKDSPPPLIPGMNPDRNDRAYNATKIGKLVYRPGTPRELVLPIFVPSSHSPTPIGKASYYNGIRVPVEQHMKEMRRFSEVSGLALKGIHTGTSGIGRKGITADLWRIKGQLVDETGDPRVVQEMFYELEDVVKSGIPRLFVEASYGCFNGSRAAELLEAKLLETMSPAEVKEKLRPIHVLTAGGCGWDFVPGITYVHLYHDEDPISVIVGPARALYPSKEDLRAKLSKLPRPGWKKTIGPFSFLALRKPLSRPINPGENAIIIKRTDQVEDTHDPEMYYSYFGDTNVDNYEVYQWNGSQAVRLDVNPNEIYQSLFAAARGDFPEHEVFRVTEAS